MDLFYINFMKRTVATLALTVFGAFTINASVLGSATNSPTNGGNVVKPKVVSPLVCPLAAPVATGATICSGNTAVVNATPSVGGNTIEWYDMPSGGTLLFIGTAYTTPVLTTTTQYFAQEVETTPGVCVSPRSAVTVTVNALPTLTSLITGTTCNAGTNGQINITPSGFPTVLTDWADIPLTNNIEDRTGLAQGTYTVTLRDGHAPACTQTFNFIVGAAPDGMNPAFTSCPSNISMNATTGVCGRTITYPAPSASDNCTVTVTQIDGTGFTSGSIFPVGTTVQTYRATDEQGNFVDCSFTVTITDVELPILTSCPSNQTINVAAGVCSSTATWVEPVASDNCPGVVRVGSHAPGSTFPAGTTTVTYTIVDINGNVGVPCMFTITVIEPTPPNAFCQNVTKFLDVAGTASVTAAEVDFGSNDACSSVTLSASPTSFTCANIGANTVTLTVTDVSGNTAMCTSTVTIVDNMVPTAICQNITLPLDGTGNATLTGAMINNGSSDNCSVASLTPSQTAFTCANLGPNSITLTVTDPSGNFSTCISTVTVTDATPPTAMCQPVTITLDGTGNASITAAMIDNGSSDACGAVTLMASQTAFTCANVGPNNVTLTVTDGSGNTATCVAVVTVQDLSVPTIASCPSNVVFNATAGTCGRTVNYVTPTFNDNCPVTVNLTAGLASGSIFPVGVTTVSHTGTDSGGNVSATCTFTVTINDNQNPVITGCPANISLTAGASCSAIANWVIPTASDNCAISTFGPVNPAHVPGATFPLGVTTVTYNATDVNGNNATPCTFTITVTDNTPPVTPVIATATGQCTVTVTAPTTTDNCSGTVTGTTADPLTYNTQGTFTITWTFTDGAGNFTTATQTVIVDDTTPPVVPVLATVMAECSASVLPAPTTTDNCSGTITGTTTDPTSYSTQGTFTVTWSFDDLNGQIVTATQTVIIDDVTPPTALCQNITVSLDAAGTVTVPGSAVNNGSTDNCGGVLTFSLSPNTFTCANVGANAVTLTVDDGNGQTSTCAATVTVNDVTAPIAICNPFTASLDATGNVTIVAADVENGSTDACGIMGFTATPLSFTCANVGPNTVVVTVTDNNGNMSTCNATVTVQDITPPAAVCQNISVNLGATFPGSVTITGVMVDNGSTDACGIATYAVSPSTFSCSNIGANAVVLTVTDVNGNVSTCNATVTVNDNSAPATPVLATITAQCSATVPTPTTTDNCAGTVTGTTLDPTFYNTDGMFVVTWSFDDGNGNVTTQTQNVNIDDTTPPVTPTLATVMAQCGTTVTAPTTTDNCAGTVTGTTADPTTFSTQGTFTINWSFTDGRGQTIMVAQTVIIDDTTNPTFSSCPTNITRANGLNNCFAIVTYPAPVAADNCSGFSVSQTDGSGLTSGDAFPIGITTQEYTVTDIGGNTALCTFTITVTDTLRPTITGCPSNIIVTTGASCSQTATWTPPLASDQCPGVVLTSSHTPGATFPVGTTTVTYTATDASANTRLCTFTVTVNDVTNPVAICNPFTTSLNAMGMATIVAADVENGSTDNCGIMSFSATPLSFTCANLGSNNVTVTVTDLSGNTNTCIAVVTVQDIINPTAICQAVTVPLDAAGNGTLTAAAVNNGSTDNCTISMLSVSPNTFTCANLGANTVTLTVTDQSGNIGTCTATATVVDMINPTAICQPVTVSLDGTGNATVTPAAVNNGSFDNCTFTLTSVTPSSFTCANIGANTVTLLVTDGSGNTGTCTSTVTVQDVMAPTAICQNVTATLDGAGTATVLASAVNNGSTDNCSIASMSLSPNTFTCANIGANAATLTVTDGSGNVATCATTITVQDVTPPTALCQNITVNLDATGNATITGAMVNNGSTDNCSVASLTPSPSTFNCSNVGPNSVILTVADPSGNTSTCTSTVTIMDVTPPIAGCQNVTVNLNAAGMASVTGAMLNSASSDACGIASFTPSPSTFNCSNLGPNNVTLTVTDVNGNSSTCTSIVTVQDLIAPVAICQTYTAALNSSGTVTITGLDVDGGSTDNCGITSRTVTPNTFNCSHVGTPQTVTLTVFDASGNSSTCNTVVTIVDNLPPTFLTCQSNITLTATVNQCGRIVNYPLPTYTDNCAGTLVLTKTDGSGIGSGDIFPVGVSNQTYVVTDQYGNSATCGFTITIIDAQAPTITGCPSNQTISTGASCSGTATWTLPVASDNCSGLTFTSTHNPGATFPVGTTTVTYTATDAVGLVTTCSFTITVNETTPPVTPTLATVTGQCSATVPTPTTTDNCDGVISGTTVNPTTYSTQGTFTVTWTFTDVSGNSTTANQTVIVDDTTPPVTPTLATVTGQCSATVLPAPTTTDNCSGTITGTTVNPTTYSSQGTFVVTWTFNDGNGNTTTALQNVIIDDTTPPVTPTLATVTGQCSASATTPSTTDNCSGTITGTTTDPTSYSAQGTYTINWTFNDGNGQTIVVPQTVVVDDTTPPVTPTLATVTGQCSATISGAPTTTDNCSGTITGTTTDPLTYSTQGIFVVVWSFNDGNGQTITANQTVVVDDTTPPVVPTLATVTGQCSATVSFPTTTDNCAGTITGTTTDPLTYSTQGTFTVSWTFNDGNGNTSTANQTVVVDDTTPPVVPTLADVTGQCTATVTAPTTTDACAGAIVGTTTNPTTYSTQGTFVVTWSFNDGNGNISTALQNVIVDDTTPPVSPTLATVTGQCSVSVSSPSTTDNCAGTITGTTSNPTFYNTQGTFVITWTFNDGNGNSTTANQTVVVDDTTPPVVPTLATVTGQCSASVTAPTTTDNCVGTVTGTTLNPTTYSTQGTFTVVWSFNDGNGNISTANQTVVVDDTTPPVVPTILTVTGQCSATVTAPTTTDNCAGTITGTTTDPTTYSTQGTFVVTWTFNDGNGNTSTATQTVVVDDTTPPVVPTLATVTGQCSATVPGAPTTTDNCSGTITGTTVNPLTYSTQGTFVVTWTFNDGNGNTSTALQNVIVDDTTPPVVPVLATVTGQCSATVTSPTTTDNCSGTIVGTTTNPTTYSTQGTFVVTWTFNDGNGNISTATQNVIVDDTTPPVVPVLATVTGQCSATVTAPTTTDNCAGTITGTTANPTTYNTQGTFTVTWTFNDGNGNTSTALQTVVVDDTTPPAVGVLANATGECSVTVSNPVANDNCAGSITGTTTDPTFYNAQGAYVITWTFNDGNGNITTTTQNVIVDDVTAPVVPIISAVAGECSALVVTAPTTTDNCAGTITGTTTDPLSYTSQGTYVITWTFNDGNGNTSTAGQTVIVDDVTAPVSPILADVTGECSAAATVPTTTDNCAGTITGTTTNPLSYSTQGTHVIIWTFDDGNGNIVSVSQNVVVDDVTAPATVVLTDVVGECSATAATPTTTDNCVGSVIGTTSDPLTYTTQGTHVITWSFNDGNGNITTVTQNVIITDVTPPSITVPADVTAVANNAGCTAANVSIGTPITSDNCSVASVTNDAPVNFPIGNTTVTWTVTDLAGNITTATQTVTVTSNITSSISEAVCVSYTAPDGATYTTSGTYTAVIPSAIGCDSTITINLTILQPTTATIVVDACDDYTAPDGTVITNSGVYTITIPNQAGCDSIITLDLIIHTFDATITIDANASTLTAVESGAGINYQWFDCSTNLGITGATNQSYIPTVSGNYGVIISDAVCADTSNCATIAINVVVPEVITPNGDGQNDFFEIPGILDYPNSNVVIFNRWGNKVFQADGYQNTWDGTTQLGIVLGSEDLPEGTYFYTIDLGEGVSGVPNTVLKGYIYLTR